MDLAPRWTIRSMLFGIVVTVSMYFLLPYLEMISKPPERDISLRSVTTAELPPRPPVPPRRTRVRESRSKPKTPKPQLQQPPRQLSMLQAHLNLSMAMGEVGGDFSVNFGVRAPETMSPELSQQVNEMIFELEDLDEPPSVIARFQPIYPPQARTRKLEGMVMLEFIIMQDGSLRNIKVVSSQPGEIFDKAATQCIKRWRFSPGTKGGLLVTSRVRQKMVFKLN